MMQQIGRYLIISGVLLVLSGCTTSHDHLYTGPERSPTDVAYLVTLDPPAPRFLLQFASIDGIKTARYDSDVEVLPGEHQIVFRCYVRSNGQTLSSPVMKITVKAGKRYEFYHYKGCLKVVMAEYPRDPRDPNKVSRTRYIYPDESGEPTLPTNDFWLVDQNGMHSQQELNRAAAIELEREARVLEWQRQQENAERERRAHQRKVIGDKICRRHGPWKDIGYIERIENTKFQIRIVRTELAVNPNLTPGNFAPSIIWDEQTHWSWCD